MTSAKDSSSRNGAPLKQGTLSFSSAKRSSSNTTAKTKKAPQARRSSSTIIGKEKKRVDDAHAVKDHDNEGTDDILELVSEEELSPPDIAAKPSRTMPQKNAIPDDIDVPISRSAKKRKEDPPAIKPMEQRRILDVENKRYREHYGRVREKMGNLKPSKSSMCPFCLAHDVKVIMCL